MISYCCLGLGGGTTTQHPGRTNGASGTRFSIPFCWAQHLATSILQSNRLVHSILLFCTWGHWRDREKMMPSSKTGSKLQYSWLWIICLRLCPPMNCCRNRMPISRARAGTKQLLGFIKGLNGGELLGRGKYFTTTVRPGSQALGQGGAPSQAGCNTVVSGGNRCPFFHQLARREWGLSSKGCGCDILMEEPAAQEALDCKRSPPGSPAPTTLSNAF